MPSWRGLHSSFLSKETTCSFENNAFKRIKGRNRKSSNTCVCIRNPFAAFLITYAERMAKRARCRMQSTSDKYAPTRKSHVAKGVAVALVCFSRLTVETARLWMREPPRGSPCFRVYLRCHVVGTFFQKRLAFPFYASVTTLYRLALPPFGLSPFSVCRIRSTCLPFVTLFFNALQKFLSVVKRIFRCFRSPYFTLRAFVKWDYGIAYATRIAIAVYCSIEWF